MPSSPAVPDHPDGGSGSGFSVRSSCRWNDVAVESASIREDIESRFPLDPFQSQDGSISFLWPCGWTEVEDLDPSYGETTGVFTQL